MEDGKIIELFFARSERAVVELSNKYGRVCRKIAFNIGSIFLCGWICMYEIVENNNSICYTENNYT